MNAWQGSASAKEKQLTRAMAEATSAPKTKKRKGPAPPPASAIASDFFLPPLAPEQTAQNIKFVANEQRWKENLEDVDVDVVIKVSHPDSCYANFYCHSTLLKMVSPVWKDALQFPKDDEIKLHVLEITDTHPWTMTFLLECIYPQYHRVLDTLPASALRDLLQLAWRYDVQSVVQQLLVWSSTAKDFRTCLLVDQLTGRHDKKVWSQEIYTNLLEAILTQKTVGRARMPLTLAEEHAASTHDLVAHLPMSIQVVLWGALLDVTEKSLRMNRQISLLETFQPYCAPPS